MIRLITTNTIRFIILTLLQIIVLNNIGLYNMVNPYIYVLFVLLLPIEIPIYLLLILSFLSGLSIDIFSNTGGIHAASTTLMAFCRPLVLTLITPRGGYEYQTVPNMRNMGFRWFILYSGFLVILHHLCLFTIEIFRFSEFGTTLLRAIASSIFTLVLIIISQYLVSSSKRR